MAVSAPLQFSLLTSLVRAVFTLRYNSQINSLGVHSLKNIKVVSVIQSAVLEVWNRHTKPFPAGYIRQSALGIVCPSSGKRGQGYA